MTLKEFISVFDAVTELESVELYTDEESAPIYSGELLHLQAACDCKNDLAEFIFDCAADDDLETIQKVAKAYRFKKYYLDKKNTDGEPVWFQRDDNNKIKMCIIVTESSFQERMSL